MAQKQILNLLSQFGLNPLDWQIKKLKSEGQARVVWFQMRLDPSLELRGWSTAFHSKLEELEWIV